MRHAVHFGKVWRLSPATLQPQTATLYQPHHQPLVPSSSSSFSLLSLSLHPGLLNKAHRLATSLLTLHTPLTINPCITSTDHTLLSRLYPHHQHDAITLTKVTTPIEHPESWVFCWARSTRAVQRLRTSAQWLWPTHTVSPDSTAGPQCLEITHFPADHMTRYIRATTSRMRALNASSAHVDQ